MCTKYLSERLQKLYSKFWNLTKGTKDSIFLNIYNYKKMFKKKLDYNYDDLGGQRLSLCPFIYLYKFST